MDKWTMSIGKQVFWGKIFVGFAWIGTGVSALFDSLLANILQIVFLLSVIIPLVMLFAFKKEEEDEMAAENYLKAKAKTSDFMHIVFCLAAIATPLLSMAPFSTGWNWPRLMTWSFFVLLGIQNLITGFTFRKLEA